MMKDFLTIHYNNAVSTEDFKAIVEKHITPEMDIDNNGKMDWFLTSGVMERMFLHTNWNTASPSRAIRESSTLKLHSRAFRINFVMPVPIYVDFGDGYVSLRTVTMVGNKSFDLTDVQLPIAPKKVTIAALNDVLATEIEIVKK